MGLNEANKRASYHSLCTSAGQDARPPRWPPGLVRPPPRYAFAHESVVSMSSKGPFSFTLSVVLTQLREACVPVTRELGDVQRNALLWLVTRTGVEHASSSFRLVDVTPDPSRLSQAAYLASLGYVLDARLIEVDDKKELLASLERILERKPHTLEHSGYADDPLTLVGLILVARVLGASNTAAAVRRSSAWTTASPLIGLIEALVDPETPPLPFAAAVSSIELLGAAFFARRINPKFAGQLFPTAPADPEDALTRVLCLGGAPTGRDLSAMLTLAAVEAMAQPRGEVAAEVLKETRMTEHVQRTVLFLAANPTSTQQLALDEEARDIEAKIRAAAHRDSLRLKTRWALRADDLLQALNEDQPAVVHFSGHGVGAAGIVLHNEAGGEYVVSSTALTRLFRALKDDIRVVVLSACFSSEQARTLTDVIDCVVGMRASINDRAARLFSASFYRALGFGRSVANAYEQGLAAIELEGLADVNVPELLVRHGVNAGSVFVVRGTPI